MRNIRFGAIYGLAGDYRDVRTACKQITEKARKAKVPVAQQLTYSGNINEFLEMTMICTEKDARRLKRYQSRVLKNMQAYRDWYNTRPENRPAAPPAEIPVPGWYARAVDTFGRYENNQEADKVLAALREDRFDLVTGRIRPAK